MGRVEDEGGAPIDTDQRNRRIGWALVAAQALMLILFVLLPKRRSLLAPPDLLDILGIS